ncbi:4-alpha-glucanotransferase/malto-oligosyltrehalose synthase,TIGR02401 [Arcticibacter tournemirensis]|uniref:4-alpha-glucanotransferase n=1 Tax=Arcticibacter tournemirensis TaxID=699437 RepID=A0A5M9GY87_9SPHI|nr:malto-oligosyltrehalose synthase [Arcticibacter tournemirensis]KAA8478939.1 malto-oligosyltrehalose synthase [Arcticibacter tournemirensis]TQM49161.1 4-alpha-glucanotransferase/malto-oligosyltrehalose synthase,TIGR02401 [Arcticibacter tournemirensis]
MSASPVSTYRLQFHKEFTFIDFERIVPYLQKLGIRTVYASPVFKSTSGSSHGYDTLDPHIINPEIGTEEQLKDLSKRLKAQGMGWLQDIVPNHMAFSPHNTWLMDVLEKGPQSLYASFFDTALSSELYSGRIMVPFLGSSLEDVIDKKELKVEYKDGRFVFNYYDSIYPLTPRSYPTILSGGEDEPLEGLQQLLSQMHSIHQIEDTRQYADGWNEFLLQLSALMKNDTIGSYITDRLNKINDSSETVMKLAEEQIYRLCNWQETDTHITFRRFFTVNGLICLNIQHPEVFNTYHQYIKSLVDKGIFTGLRVDHIDGLFDPATYLKQLRELVGDQTYVTVEKILEPGEEIPQDWPIQGNTGYDFLALVNNLFTSKKSEKQFTGFYSDLIGEGSEVQEQIYAKKAYILYQHMGGELDNLYNLLLSSDLFKRTSARHIHDGDLKRTIGEFIIQCPVYRYYGNSFPLNRKEEEAIRKVFSRISSEKPALTAAVKLLEESLLDRPKEGDTEYNSRALNFYQRCMQFSGPLMAKGVEDTLMYTYNRFIVHNEVGDSPEAFGMTQDEFHTKMIQRQQNWPLSMNATSTHDTKRGEDVRARLNVLSNIPDEWLKNVEEWLDLNKSVKPSGSPDLNDEYLIYQTLLGTFPMPGQDEDNFKERIQEYIQKALREAKQNSDWAEPNTSYEEAAKRFAANLLDTKGKFRKSFDTFHQKVADYGIINSLAQVLLKFTCPGVPDVYQGCELWDLSMVDPDNRRPVDYNLRTQILNELESYREDSGNLPSYLWEKRYEGHIKLWITGILLKERAASSALFEKGDYLPLKVKGAYKDNVLAFARRYQQNWYIIVIPLHIAALCGEQDCEIQSLNWKNTRILLPETATGEWEHLLNADVKGKAEQEIRVEEIFDTLPLALLKLERKVKERGAGILMHITSLPSPFGSGDFGPEAIKFADFLARSGQKYWQILPLSPTEQGSGNSPYSSYSSMAGNPLLISPELLAEAGLLSPKKLQDYYLPLKSKADFKGAEQLKDVLFEKAYRKFQKGDFSKLKRDFAAFCKKEALWLDDFSLYIVLKQQHKGQAWYQWPEEYKLRNRMALDRFRNNNSDALNKARWLQFIFATQWNDLKAYCNNLGIALFGDMPFYVSYDSADVWSNREIFCLDNDGNMTGVAGVPPDYFNENGQLWGMPVFRWDILKKQGYNWWLQRIRKNIELFDLLRFDHFRAFSAYWEVPASEDTAKNGIWKPGPGKDFFRTIQKKLGKLPFVAEDLGDIDAPVYELRDTFGFPGMKVLQFAFGDDMPQAIAIPHQYTQNFFAYTGTHDNNTTRGWFEKDADKTIRENLNDYTGVDVKAKNVHEVMARLAYASVAKTVIIPLQDVLGLDAKARMNSPATTENNWQWRLKPGELTGKEEEQLRKWVKIYNRD